MLKKCLIILLLTFSCLIAQVFHTEKLSFRVEPILHGLSNPWSMVWFPDTQKGLIAERNGSLVLFDLINKKKWRLSVPADVYQAGQGGLLDLTLDPDYLNNGWIYLTFSIQKGFKNTTVLARFKIINRKLSFFKVVFEAAPAVSSSIHFGSRLVFPESSNGPVGDLFLTVGERNYRDLSQDTQTHIGKVIRFKYQSSFIPEVYSYGHRNPQGMVWDNLGDQLLIHEHGAMGGDEINVINKGKNYGWPVISYGRNYNGSKIGEGQSKEGMEQPIYYWDPSIAPSGFAVYHGKEFSEWEGDLLVGSLKFGLLVRLEMNANRDKVVKEEKMLDNKLGRIRYVGVREGEIYLLTDSPNGIFFRLTKIH